MKKINFKIFLIILFCQTQLFSQNWVDIHVIRSGEFDQFVEENNLEIATYDLQPYFHATRKTDSLKVYRDSEFYGAYPLKDEHFLDLPDGNYIFEYRSFYGMVRSIPYNFKSDKYGQYRVNLNLEQLPFYLFNTRHLTNLSGIDTCYLIGVEQLMTAPTNNVGHYIEKRDTIQVIRVNGKLHLLYRDVNRKLSKDELFYVDHYISKLKALVIPEELTDNFRGSFEVDLNGIKIAQNEMEFKWMNFELLKWRLGIYG